MNEKKKPAVTVDVIIEYGGGVVLIKRKYPPEGWAIPGGFVEYGETLEEAAVREVKEETGLDVKLLLQFFTYSDPGRDPRRHTITTVYIASGTGRLKASDDAAEAGVFTEGNLPSPLAFDHEKILNDYFRFKKTGKLPRLEGSDV